MYIHLLCLLLTNKPPFGSNDSFTNKIVKNNDSFTDKRPTFKEMKEDGFIQMMRAE